MPRLVGSPAGQASRPVFPLPQPLVKGRLVRRYKRFLADVVLDDGTPVTVHCPNSGSMLGMAEPGSPVLLSRSANAKRKLPWTWELVRPPDAPWVGCNTMRPNAVVAWAIREGLLPGVEADAPLRREVRYGSNSRIDIMAGDHHIEVKNTTLARPAGAAQDGIMSSATSPRAYRSSGTLATHVLAARPAQPRVAQFPDAVTSRGAKHMRELAEVARSGLPATVVFFVNRADCDRFAVARDIDSSYGAAFDEAVDAGVEMIPLGMDVGPDGWRVRGPLPMA